MNLKDYQQHAERTMPQLEQRELMINAVFGLAGEVGEMIDSIKKHLFQGHPLDPERVAYELGDQLWYIVEMCKAIGIPLETVAWMNVQKLKERYPDGFDTERSQNRGR